MKMNGKKWLIPGILCAAAIVLASLLWEKNGGRSEASDVWENSIFSWNSDYMLPEYEARIRAVMDRLSCKAFYQEIPEDADRAVVLDFLKRRKDSGQHVYYLAGQIAFEVAAARRYNKGILHITEMQAPGYHDLTENNTYYSDGIDAASASHQRLAQAFDYERLGFSWHYLRPLLELMGEDSHE